jgi:allantoate deiminase
LTPAAYTLDLCDRIAARTDVPGTIHRTFLSPATAAVHALLRAEMEALDMTVRTDSVGNVRGIYPANRPGAPVLLTGSHIDTVPDAGRYDGILGVALPIALIRKLNGERLPYAIEIIAFSEEEGVRFKLPFIGSRALVNDFGAADLAGTDANGISIAQAIRNFGLDPDHIADAALTPGTFAFFEAHIEQGPVLEALSLPLGVVTTIIGQSRLGLTFHGQANHAGTTPMSFRKDALAAAAEWISAVEAYPTSDPHLLATVGSIQASPGAANVIPGAVTVSLDVRHPDDAARLSAVSALVATAESCAEARGLTVTVVDRGAQASVPMDAALRGALMAAAAPSAPHSMPSGAGHDAMILARKIPAAMLFLRTPGGLSHHPNESVAEDDIAAAITACLDFLHALAPQT